MKYNPTCAIIAPRQEEMVGYRSDGYLADCIRGVGHPGPHVVRTPEGKLIAWEDDWNCGCCKPEEDQRCTIFWIITEGDLEALKRKQA